MAQHVQAQGGPPYVSTTVATTGGRPTVQQDIPVCAVLICLYLLGAIANMTIFQRNRRRSHKFSMSWAIFGFCMSRVVTCILRLVWATRPYNARIIIAAQIFTNAGVLVIYIVVLLLALRVFRATHPKLGWNRSLSKILTVSYVFLLIALLLTIAFTILTFYTLNITLRKVAMWIQRGSILYMLLFNVASLVLVLISALLPRACDNENFGSGSMASKIIILCVAVFFCIFIAGFRAGTAWSDPRPASDPAWFQSKPAFYIILFAFELVIVYLFIFTRIDKVFWVPNGSSKPGDYSQIEPSVIDLDNSTVSTRSEQEMQDKV